jgi:hypothetical protein
VHKQALGVRVAVLGALGDLLDDRRTFPVRELAPDAGELVQRIGFLPLRVG